MNHEPLDWGALCPPPQEAQSLGGSVEVRLPWRVTLQSDVAELYPLFEAARERGWIGSIDAMPQVPDAQLRLAVRIDRTLRPQSFELLLREPECELIGADLAGVRYGIQLLHQVLAGATRVRSLPCTRIRDYPDFATRGVLLDISRTRIPTRRWLLEFLDTLESLRINQLQLYTEHAFAYLGHEAVWQDSSPLTSDDLLALDAHARARGIELVPNQQSFGHLHRWLIHEPYRSMAEAPEGVEHAFSRHREPFAICPTDPRSLPFLEGLWDQLLPHFQSRLFNIGADETFDLGLGRSGEACATRGKGRVYLEFLQALESRVRARGRRMQFWGDIILQHPELIAELPRQAIALEWGYDADHPFAKNLEAFAKSGLEFHVCPGTSSWQSFGGRTENMLANISSAAREGQLAGASGLLVTDWGDRGHLQPHLVAWPGIVTAAALSWNRSSAGVVRARLADWLNRWVWRDRRVRFAQTVLDLGRAAEWSGARSTNGSPLFFLLAFADLEFPHPRVQGLEADGLFHCLERLSSARIALESTAPEHEHDRDQARWVGDILAFACRLGIARLRAGPGVPLQALPRSQARQLARELEALIDEHQRLWWVDDRPGGYRESASWLRRPCALLNQA